MTAQGAHAASAMDAMYRYQRHIYDATRRPYLLGRDVLIARLDPPLGGTVLEIGCGTGRNLVHAARRYPHARFFGIDVSSQMLATARRQVDASGLGAVITLAQADATAFDSAALFGVARFDRVFVSYALSMIPPWKGVVAGAARATAPDGELHVVDFGPPSTMPRWLRPVLLPWLSRFHVMPREDVAEALRSAAADRGAVSEFRLYRGGYACLGRVAFRHDRT